MAIAPSRLHTYDMVVHQGMDKYRPLVFQEPDGAVPDLSDWTATLAIYAAPATLESLHEYDPILTGNTTDGKVVLGRWDGGDGLFFNCYIGLTSFITSSLSPWGIGIYNLDIIDPYGHLQYRVRGRIQLEEGTKHG